MSVLRYPGGKSRAAKFIVPLLPGDRDLFSPCFGGGHAEFAWSELHPGRRMLGCELFEPVATFWQQARLNPGAVADIAARYHPIDQAGFAELQQRVRAGIDDPVELAALTYVLNRSSFSGATLRGGSSQEARAKRWTQSAIDRLRAFKAPNTEVRHTDGLDALETLLAHHSPDAWDIYVDPPYEAVEGLYGSGSAHHEDFDHERLAALLRWADALGWNWIVSGNEAMAETYPGYQYRPRWSGGMSPDRKRRAKDEVLFRSEASMMRSSELEHSDEISLPDTVGLTERSLIGMACMDQLQAPVTLSANGEVWEFWPRDVMRVRQRTTFKQWLGYKRILRSAYCR